MKRFNIKVALESATPAVDAALQEVNTAEDTVESVETVLDQAVSEQERQNQAATDQSQEENTEATAEQAPAETAEVTTGEAQEEAPAEEASTQESSEEGERGDEEGQEDKEEEHSENNDSEADDKENEEERDEDAVGQDARDFEIVAESLSEAEELQGQIDAAQDDVAVVDRVMDTIRERESTGGITEGAAEIAEIVIDGVAERQGIEPSEQDPIIATEGFASPSMRIHHGRVAMEKAEGLVARIVAAISDGISKVMEFAEEFFKFVFNATARAREDAIKFKKTLEKSKDILEGSDVEGSYDKKQLLRYLGERPMDTLMGITKRMKDMKEVVNDSKAMIERTRAILDSAVGGGNIGNMESIVLSSDNLPTFMRRETVPGYAAPEGLVAYASDTTYGGGRLIAYVAEKADATFEHMSSSRWFMGVDQRVLPEVDPVPYLTYKEMVNMVDASVQACDGIESLKSAQKALAAARKQLLGTTFKIRALALNGAKPGSKVTVDFARKAMVAVNAVNRFYDAPVKSMTGLCLRTMKAAMDYAKSSAKARGEAHVAELEEKATQAA